VYIEFVPLKTGKLDFKVDYEEHSFSTPFTIEAKEMKGTWKLFKGEGNAAGR
jgi:hypothetical protein